MNKWLKVILIGIGLVAAALLGFIAYRQIKIKMSGLTETEYDYRQSEAFQNLKKEFPLIAAAREGDIKKAKELLDAGADINQIDVKSILTWESYGMLDIYPLSEAIRAGNDEMVKFLIDRGANVNLLTSEDLSPLHYAIAKNKATIVPILLKAGVDIKTGSWIDVVAKHLHSDTDKESSLKIIKELIAAGAPVDDLTGVYKFVNSNTALAAAALYGRDDLVKLLLDAGADVNLGVSKELKTLDKTALHAVARGPMLARQLSDQEMERLLDSYKKTAQLLIGAGASIDVKDKNGDTPMFLACRNNNLGVAELLLQAGANVKSGSILAQAMNAIFNPENVDLYYMFKTKNQIESHKKIIKMLIDAGALINEPGPPAGRTPLAVASVAGRDDLIKLLLDAGADPALKDQDGTTSLHEAAVDAFANDSALGTQLLIDAKASDNALAAQLLIDAKAPINAKDRQGNTPLHKAASSISLNVARVLLKAGADSSIKNNEGKTPLDLAKETSKNKIIVDVATSEIKQRLQDVIALLEKAEAKK